MEILPLMKGEKYMEEYKEIEAYLCSKNNSESVIELKFNPIIEINLSKNEQKGLKESFTMMIQKALEEKYILKFSKEESFQNQSIIDVAKCYVDELNEELKKLYQEEIFKEISEFKEE